MSEITDAQLDEWSEIAEAVPFVGSFDDPRTRRYFEKFSPAVSLALIAEVRRLRERERSQAPKSVTWFQDGTTYSFSAKGLFRWSDEQNEWIAVPPQNKETSNEA